MNVVIVLEEKQAQIHIVPTTPLNKAQLALVRSYGEKNIRLKHGEGDELVLVLEYTNGDTPTPDLVERTARLVNTR